VRRGMRVAAHHSQTRLSQAELRPDDVHDALIKITQAVDADAAVSMLGRYKQVLKSV